MNTELVASCPICHHTEFIPWLTTQDHFFSKEQFHLVACAHCQFVITNPRPSESTIGKYYQSEEYISHSDSRKTIQDKTYQLARYYATRKKIKLIESYHQSGSILDIGCGTGELLQRMNPSKWTRVGIEPSNQARGKIATNITVYPSFQDLPNKFQVISLWHVLEHLHQLEAAMTFIEKHLANAGTLFIAVPNRESADAQHYGTHWAAYDTPRHLWHFTKENMQALLHHFGFQIQAIRPMPLDAFYVCLLSEKYAHPESHFATRAAKALYHGLTSNLRAGKDNYSSLLYIASR
ncbi:MAG: class I SAM-dependent methyltransferase [Bacteroidota bacterium]